MNEIWKDIKGFEQFYQISNLGRVKSKNRIVNCGNGKQLKHGKILSPVPNSNGYLRICLKANGISNVMFVHRLVAIHFVPNPNNFDTVNHLDFNPLNNRSENLEWTTRFGNYKYSFQKGRFKRTSKWKDNLKKTLNERMATPVIGTNIATGNIVKFTALNDTKLAGFQPSCVCNCCKGIRATHKGYRWSYA